MHAAMSSFGSFAAANPAVVSAALENEFGLASLAKVANANGFEMGEKEIDGLLTNMVSNSKVRMSYRDADGELRELTLDEAQLAGGGIGLAAVVVTVVVLVVAGAAVIAAAAVAISTKVWAHTSVWTYGSQKT